MRRRNERGTVTVFVVSMTVALLLVAGLVFDGGRVITAHREADAVAEAAARAGAQGLDESGLRQSAGAPIRLPEAAARVERYLATTGFTGTTAVTGDVITVTVQRTQPFAILSLAGLRTSSIEGSGSARAVRSIRGEP